MEEKGVVDQSTALERRKSLFGWVVRSLSGMRCGREEEMDEEGRKRFVSSNAKDRTHSSFDLS